MEDSAPSGRIRYRCVDPFQRVLTTLLCFAISLAITNQRTLLLFGAVEGFGHVGHLGNPIDPLSCLPFWPTTKSPPPNCSRKHKQKKKTNARPSWPPAAFSGHATGEHPPLHCVSQLPESLDERFLLSPRKTPGIGLRPLGYHHHRRRRSAETPPPLGVTVGPRITSMPEKTQTHCPKYPFVCLILLTLVPVLMLFPRGYSRRAKKYVIWFHTAARGWQNPVRIPLCRLKPTPNTG